MSDIRPIPKLAGVCGWPIHHSLSPVLHSYWLKRSAISGAYVPFAVQPDKAIESFQSLKRTSIVGVNVTLPLKRQAFLAADSHTPDAAKLGVANCLYKSGENLIAHNTDLQGFAAPLLKHVTPQSLAQSSVLVIGAGGASRAVIGSLLSLNVPEICLMNRTESKAEDLVKSVDVPNLYTRPWADRDQFAAQADIIVNATSAGMKGFPKLDLSLKLVKQDCLVYDLIYTPKTTPLMRAAKLKGCRVLGGLDMLIEQARPSFKLFFGALPPEFADPTETLYQCLESGVR